MNNKKAIEILQKQIDKLLSTKQNRNESWIIETQTYVINFFGKESHQNNFFKYYSWTPNPDFDPDFQEKQTIIFLNDCIDTIKNIGIYKEPKQNFLNQLSDSLLVLILSVIGIVSFGLGKYTSDVQNIELKSKLEELTKSSNPPANAKIQLVPTQTIIEKKLN